MKINMEVDDVAVSISILVDINHRMFTNALAIGADECGMTAAKVVDVLIEPALLALGYHQDSIHEVFASYARTNDEEEKDETWEAGFAQGYKDGSEDVKKGRSV